MADYSELDATWLARMAHDAIERGNEPVLAGIRAEIARRPSAVRQACSREWIRQAPLRERARRAATRAPPAEDWCGLAAELRRLIHAGLGDGPGTTARSGGAATGRPAVFDPLGLPECIASDAEPHASSRQPRWEHRLSDHAGLTDLGVDLTRLAPGTRAPRHRPAFWRDEFVCVLSGEVVLETDAGEEMLRAGMCVAFPAGTREGCAFLNRSGGDVLLLVVGDRTPGDVATNPRPPARPGASPGDSPAA